MHEGGKPLIGYFGVHIAFLVRGREEQLRLYRRFRDELVPDPRNTFATVAPYISLQIFHHLPVEVPAVRPLSVYTLPATYSAIRPNQVLFNKRPVAFWDIKITLDTFSKVNGEPFHFMDALEGGYSFTEWCEFRAAVYFPYDWLQTMALYDWANMAIPTFVPDLPMYTFSRGTNALNEWLASSWLAPSSVSPHNYNDWADLPGRVYWWLMTDFRALPGVETFASISELFGTLSSQEALWRQSGVLRQAQQQRAAQSALFWRSAALRALSPAPAAASG